MISYTHQINYYETDKMGITHHSNYLRFMEEARIYFLDKIGWSYAKMEEVGLYSPVLSVTCEYKKTTTFPDILRIDVEVQKLKGLKMEIAYKMYVGDNLVTTASSSHAFFDKNQTPVFLEKKYPELYKVLQEHLIKQE
ncbi:MAG: acyl-CoA thioesterase [Treponema sp.]|nr:acyl-CoA thioesterase [Treponema sp.]